MMPERVTFNAIYYGETWLTSFRGNTKAKWTRRKRLKYRNKYNWRVLKRIPKKKKYKQFKLLPRLLSSLSLWEELYQGLMDGFLGVFIALWKGLYSHRDCIRQHINFPAVVWAGLKTKDVRFTQWPDVAFSTIGEGIYRWPFI